MGDLFHVVVSSPVPESYRRFSRSWFPAFFWIWAVFVTTTSDGITVKLFGPFLKLLISSYFHGLPVGWSRGRGGRRSRFRRLWSGLGAPLPGGLVLMRSFVRVVMQGGGYR